MKSATTMATWLITVCSTGLGCALAEEVLGRGHNAVVTARNASAVADLVEAHPENASGVALDVTDPAQVAEAVRRAEERFGQVVVTGASSGIGAATARALAADGHRIALLARRTDRIAALAKELDNGSIAIEADVTDRSAIVAAAERVQQELGGADVLVNNAGRGASPSTRSSCDRPARRPDPPRRENQGHCSTRQLRRPRSRAA